LPVFCYLHNLVAWKIILQGKKCRYGPNVDWQLGRAFSPQH
jgi:hypothetical protein